MNLEENKMLCETIINILFGIEFEKLPSVNVLRCIEDNIGVNLEFKHHFRFLVPQVNGWETMESWMETKGWLKWKNADKDKTWLNRLNRISLWPVTKSPTYFEINREYLSRYGEQRYGGWAREKYPEKVGLALLELLVYFRSQVEEEENYLISRKKREAVIEEIYEQFDKQLAGKASMESLITEFVNGLIENNMKQCTATLSSEDSGLKTFWDEFCVQVQQEQSYYWNSYLDTLSMWIKQEFEKLPLWKRNAIWFELMKDDIAENMELSYDEYMGYYNFGVDVKAVDVTKDYYYDFDDVRDLITERIEGIAADYSDDAIEKYIEGNYEYD